MRKLYCLTIVAVFMVGLPVKGERIKPAKKAYRKGKRYVKRHDYIRAIPYLKEATNHDPENAWYQFLLGKAYFEGDRPVKSLSSLLAAFRMDQSVHPEIEYYMARAMHMNGMFEDATIHYRSDLSRYEEGSYTYQDTEMRIQQCLNAPALMAREVRYRADNLGDYVNTEYPEYAASFAENYTYMVFTSRRPRRVKQRAERRFHVSDINEEVYEAKRVNGVWTKTKLFTRPIPKMGHDASISITENGKTMLYYLGKNQGDIYISNNEDGKWSRKENIGANINTEEYNEPSAVITDDGQTLIWVSNKPEGMGMKDIYVSTRQGESWSDGMSIGAHINTAYDDDAPFVSSDGQSLFFSSRGHNSMGGYDLFRCARQDDGSWGKPENMGYPVNSVGDDIYYFEEDGTDGFFFSSDRPGGYGEKDIYHALPFVPDEASTVVAGTVLDRNTQEPVAADVRLLDKLTGEILSTTATDPDNGKYRFVLPDCGEEYQLDVQVDAPGSPEVKIGNYNVVTGEIFDAVSERPLDAQVELIDINTNEVLDRFSTNPETGRYIIPVESGRRYMLRVRSNEYLPYYEEFNVSPTGEVVAHPHEIGLQRQTEARKLVITWQFFDHDKSVIKADYHKDLDHVVNVLNKVPEVKLNIIGHTDADGGDAYNQRLSVDRAQSVADFLRGKGIDGRRLNVSGMGETMPIYDNSDPEFKKWNRRVELYIIE